LNLRRVINFLTIIIIICSTTFYVTEVTGNGVSPITRKFYPTNDAYVSAENPNTNYNNRDYLFVRSALIGGDARSFIKFDLSSIPPGSYIHSAILKLFMFDAPDSSRVMLCHRVTESDWSESTITWNNQPGVTELVTSVATGTQSNVWLSLIVTYSVEKFTSKDASGYAPNYGWRLRDESELSAFPKEWRMYSKEHSDSTKRPYLEVTYYPPHLELSFASASLKAGEWVKMTVYRKTKNGDSVTRGTLEVKLTSTSTSANKKFSLTPGGSAITKLTIPDGSDHKDFYYYDDKAGTWNIRVWTEDYTGYGEGIKQLTVTPGPLDHFVFNTITSPQIASLPFSVTITAYDAYNNVKTDYAGTNTLSDTTGTIEPKVTSTFVNGRWTGMVTIKKKGDNVKIITSGGGKTGESNPFTVKPGLPVKLVITPSSFTMAAGITYSYLTISLRDINDDETTYPSNIIVSLSTTSQDGEFRQFGTTTKISSITIPAGSSTVKVDYYDIRGGTHTLTASAAGLASGTTTVTVIPDTVPPVTTITISSPKYLIGTMTYVSNSTVFELSASDNASGVKETRYRIDGGSWNTYAAGFTLSTLSDGSHTIGYHSIDRADNNEAEKTITIILDKTPPVIRGASPIGSLILDSASVRFVASVEDTGSGVKEVRLTVDGVSQGSMTTTGGGEYSKTLSLAEGSHTWSIEALDNLDNTRVWSGSFTLTIDTSPPTISGLSAPSSPVFGEQIIITCEASDELSGIREVKLYYSTNGGASWTEVAMTLQAGRYTGTIPSQMPFTSIQYYVKAVDNAGNEYRTQTSTLSVGIPIWFYVAVIAIIIVIVAILLLRRRKPVPPPPPPPPS